MSILDKFKKTAKNLEKSIKEGSFKEKAEKTLEEIGEVIPEKDAENIESISVIGKRAYIMDRLANDMLLSGFKDLNIKSEDHQISAKYQDSKSLGRGEAKLNFKQEEENVKINISLKVYFDTSSRMEATYKKMYDIITNVFNEAEIVDKGIYRGIYQDIKSERGDKLKGFKDMVGISYLEEKFEEMKENEANRILEEEKAARDLGEDLKTKLIYAKGSNSIIGRINKDLLYNFSNEYSNRLFLSYADWKSSRLKYGKYIDQRAIDMSKEDYAKDILKEDRLLFHYYISNNEGVIMTDRKLYISMHHVHSDNPYKMEILLEDIENIDIYRVQDDNKHVFEINGIDLFYIYRDTVAYSLDNYFYKLKNNDLEIEDEEVSNLIYKNMDSNLKDELKYHIELDNLKYIVFGGGALLNKNTIAINEDKMIVLEREILGVSKDIKEFNIRDIEAMRIRNVRENPNYFDNIFLNIFYKEDSIIEIDELMLIDAKNIIRVLEQIKKDQ